MEEKQNTFSSADNPNSWFFVFNKHKKTQACVTQAYFTDLLDLEQDEVSLL